MVVAPAGTMATWLNAGLATSPAGCKRVMSMLSTVAPTADTVGHIGLWPRPRPGPRVWLSTENSPRQGFEEGDTTEQAGCHTTPVAPRAAGVKLSVDSSGFSSGTR